MKRLVLGLALSAGMLFASMSTASAAFVCQDDPNLGIGTPIKSSVNLSVNLLGQSVNANTTTTKTSTSFTAGFSIL